MKKSELRQIIKEMLINELDISKYLSSWIDTKTLKKAKDFLFAETFLSLPLR